MTLGPGGSYPAIRRRKHRQRRGQTQAQAMQSQRTTQARSGGGGYAAGTFFNPAAPYTLYGSYVTPGGGTSSGGTPQKAQKALPPLKAA